MYTQKLYKNGNSIAVTIPKQALKDFNLRDGSQVEVVPTASGLLITKQSFRVKPRKDFLVLLDKVNEQYGEALREIAKR